MCLYTIKTTFVLFYHSTQRPWFQEPRRGGATSNNSKPAAGVVAIANRDTRVSANRYRNESDVKHEARGNRFANAAATERGRAQNNCTYETDNSTTCLRERQTFYIISPTSNDSTRGYHRRPIQPATLNHGAFQGRKYSPIPILAGWVFPTTSASHAFRHLRCKTQAAPRLQ